MTKITKRGPAYVTNKRELVTSHSGLHHFHSDTQRIFIKQSVCFVNNVCVSKLRPRVCVCM